jgi:hypothetical protein
MHGVIRGRRHYGINSALSSGKPPKNVRRIGGFIAAHLLSYPSAAAVLPDDSALDAFDLNKIRVPWRAVIVADPNNFNGGILHFVCSSIW